jgi:dTDP-4-dehydrorhamnose 3,5-epimerase
VRFGRAKQQLYDWYRLIEQMVVCGFRVGRRSLRHSSGGSNITVGADSMKLQIQPLSLPGVMLVRGARFTDQRGYFAETYARPDFVAVGLDNDFIQDNQSLSTAAGTIRGLHFQNAPFEQAKLVRVLRGRIFDVAVDLRRWSPSFGQHVSVELSAESGDQLFVPAGFAHGFCTLVPDTEVFYKVDAVYSAAHDAGVNWADPEIGIRWPVAGEDAILSDKDRQLPPLRAVADCFA